MVAHALREFKIDHVQNPDRTLLGAGQILNAARHKSKNSLKLRGVFRQNNLILHRGQPR
jgi:hypothetical protein